MIQSIANKLLSDIQATLENKPSTLQAGAMEPIKQAVNSALQKLDVVTREEFDIQNAILLRTREKVEALEKRLEELEQTADTKR